MGNPVGQSHKPIHVRDGGGKPFPSFTTERKNKLKNNVTEWRKKLLKFQKVDKLE